MPNNFGNIKFQTLDGRELDAKLYCHSETVNINGTNYYLLKSNTPADGSGVSLSASTGSVARVVWGKFVFPLSDIRSIQSATINAIYRAYTTGGTVNAEIDIKILKSDNTVRTTIATGVSKSSSLGTSWSTLTGADYSFSRYDVVDQTDYLEIDYIANVTSAKIGKTAFLRIDSSTLPETDQTRSQEWNFLGIVKKYLAIRHSVCTAKKYLAIRHNIRNVAKQRISLNYSSYYIGWAYRKSHIIQPSSGAGTNYQVKIIVHYGSGTDSGENVYLNYHCRSDFGDIRFTKSDGVTFLDYWMESYTASDNAVFWVEIADDLSTNNQTIYIYYGNTSATTTSNGASTFLFFDDFATNTLDNYTETYDSGGSPAFSYDASGQRVVGYTTDAKQHHLTHNTFTVSDHKIGVKIISGQDGGMCFRFVDQYNFYLVNFYDSSDPSTPNCIRVWRRASGTWTELGNYVSISNTAGSVHQLYFGFYGIYLYVWWDGTLVIDMRFLGTMFTSGKFGPRISSTPSTNPCYHDDLRVSKFVASEPNHGSWGSEETLNKITKTLKLYQNIVVKVYDKISGIFSVLQGLQTIYKSIIQLFYILNFKRKSYSILHSLRNKRYSTFTVKEKILNSVLKLFKPIWNLRNVLYVLKSFIWKSYTKTLKQYKIIFGLRNRVSDSIRLIYNVRNLISKKFYLIYKLLNKVCDSVKPIYSIRNRVYGSYRLLYSIINRIYDSIKSVYSIRNRIYKSYKLLYGVIGKVLDYIKLAFTIRNRVYKTSKLLYSIINKLHYALSTKWNIRNILPKRIVQFYSLRNKTLKLFRLIYNVRTAIFDLIKTEYNILHSVIAKVSTKYGINNLVKSAISSTYNIFGKAILRTGVLLYSTLNKVYSRRSLYYYIRNLVSDYAKLQYSTLNSVKDHLTMIWKTLNKSALLFKANYNIRNLISIRKSILYSIRNLVKIAFNVKFSLRNLILKSFVPIYFVLHIVYNSIIQAYSIRNLIMNLKELKYSISKKVYYTFKQLYNIRNRIYGLFRVKHNILNLIIAKLLPIYTIRNIVSEVLKIRYTILGKAIAVFKTSIYSIRNRVQIERTAIYGIMNLVHVSLSSLYLLYNRISRSLSKLYGISGIISKMLVANWNILSKIYIGVSFKWSSLLFRRVKLAVSYGIRSLIKSMLNVRHNLSGLIVKELLYSWNILNKRINSVSAVFNVRNLTKFIISLSYGIMNSVVNFVRSSYNIMNRVSEIISANYNLFKVIYASLHSIFKIKSLVKSMLILQHGILARIKYELKSLWDIGYLKISKLLKFDWNVQYVIKNLIISIRSLPIYSTAKTNIFVSYRRLFNKLVMLEKTIKEVSRRLFRRVVK